MRILTKRQQRDKELGSRYIRGGKHCKICGKGMLQWDNRSGRWRLRNGKHGRLHICEKEKVERKIAQKTILIKRIVNKNKYGQLR